jgi:hypothetical protein
MQPFRNLIRKLGAAGLLLSAVLLVLPPAFAQSCDSLTGFAKQVCLAQAASSAAGVAGAADKAMKDFTGDPLTTSLSDVVRGDTLPPTVEPKAFDPLLKLERAPNGSFILRTGIFELYAESYSLEPYDQQWARPSGFFPAPIKGRRAKVISDILKYTELHPEVAQATIQNLLGLTVYGTDFEKMPVQTQQAAVRILPRETLLLIKGAAQAKSLEKILLDRLGHKLPKVMQKAADAAAKAEQIDTEHQITATLKDLKTNSDAQQFTASGPRGTWLQMPGGFFIRYLPEGYAKTRLQVIVPEAAMEGVDPKKPLTFDPTQYLAVHAGTPAQRLGITLRPVGGR